MKGQTTFANQKASPPWAADFLSRDHIEVWPAKIDPTQFTDGLGTKVKTGAAAAYGATTITVDALPGALPVGAQLEFNNPWASVEVTLDDTDASAGVTSITVAALSGPLPSGAVLDFGGGTNAQLAKLSASAAEGATTLTVSKLDGAIADSSVATFAGGKKLAILTASAASAATSITVSALGLPIANDDEAVYSKYGRKTIKSGTFVGRTYAERDAGTAFGPVDKDDDEQYLVLFDVQDANENDDIELYRHGGTVKENFLPEWTTISTDTAILADLRAAYHCIKGAD